MTDITEVVSLEVVLAECNLIKDERGKVATPLGLIDTTDPAFHDETTKLVPGDTLVQLGYIALPRKDVAVEHGESFEIGATSAEDNSYSDGLLNSSDSKGSIFAAPPFVVVRGFGAVANRIIHGDDEIEATISPLTTEQVYGERISFYDSKPLLTSGLKTLWLLNYWERQIQHLTPDGSSLLTIAERLTMPSAARKRNGLDEYYRSAQILFNKIMSEWNIDAKVIVGLIRLAEVVDPSIIALVDTRNAEDRLLRQQVKTYARTIPGEFALQKEKFKDWRSRPAAQRKLVVPRKPTMPAMPLPQKKGATSGPPKESPAAETKKRRVRRRRSDVTDTGHVVVDLSRSERMDELTRELDPKLIKFMELVCGGALIDEVSVSLAEQILDADATGALRTLKSVFPAEVNGIIELARGRVKK